MTDGKAVQSVAAKAPVLVAIAIVLGLIPRAMMALGARGLPIGLTVLLLTLALCALGFASGRFRIFWCCWGVASVAFFLLFGMATPVGMVLAMPMLLSN
ncbi:hypothetical protein ASC90_03120 [Rhizobium sp. Root1220]|nr:hypothetical protein ASC90_03120 [Rhizobium sp. Root1220]